MDKTMEHEMETGLIWGSCVIQDFHAFMLSGLCFILDLVIAS